MDEPKKKRKISFEQFEQAILGTGRQQITPEDQLKQARAQNILNLTTNPTRQDSLTYDRLHPGQKSIFPQPKSETDILKEKTAQVNYKKSLLDLQEKQKKSDQGKIEDLDKKEAKALKRIKTAQDIISKTKEDEFGNERSYYPKKIIEHETKRSVQYTDSLRVINITKLMRNKFPDINTNEVRQYFDKRTSNIDKIAAEFVKRGVTPRDATRFKQESMQKADELITKSLEGGYELPDDPYKIAMSQAAASLELIYPDILKRK